MRKLTVLAMVGGLSMVLLSCESTNSRRAGGGAFDDTPMGRTLDANAVVPEAEDLAGESFGAWRELRE